jgi:NTP pyrophosphatase (non-canonical NTP hydrolase)
MSTDAVLAEVGRERLRQDEKWGEQNHDPFCYVAILTEEIGELAQAALHTRYGGSQAGVRRMREEALQAAAVAVAMVECLDRGAWEWGGHADEDTP